MNARIRISQYTTMLISPIAMIPVRLSNAAIPIETLCWYLNGKMLTTAIRIKRIITGGANACIRTAAVQSPLSSNVIAVVKPHPGQVTSSAKRIGHCHPPKPMAVETTWMTPNPVKMRTSFLLCSMAARTGVKNHAVFRCDMVSQQVSGF